MGEILAWSALEHDLLQSVETEKVSPELSRFAFTMFSDLTR